jgi:hypothetical protein
LSYGLRYEWQTNITDHGDFAPRIGFAWAPGSARNGRQKTVFRGGFGFFYDRVNDSLIKQAFLLNGINQLSYTVTNPDTFPNAPSLANLSPAQNSIYRLDPNLRSDYMIQSAIGVERQLPRNTTVAVTYTTTRALHLQQTVPINTPLPGTYISGLAGSGLRPYGLAAGNLFEYESGGHMRQNILMANFNTRFSKNVSLFGNYQFNHSMDLPGTPTDPYNFAQDWGRSSLERRHRFQLVGSVVAPLNIRMSPFVTVQSGSPYDVVLGRDIYGDTLKNARPTFATASCNSADMTLLGDFCTNPIPGVTDNLVPFPCVPWQIQGNNVDYVVEVESIGDPAKIVSGTTQITRSPDRLRIAELVARFLREAGIICRNQDSTWWRVRRGARGLSLFRLQSVAITKSRESYQILAAAS